MMRRSVSLAAMGADDAGHGTPSAMELEERMGTPTAKMEKAKAPRPAALLGYRHLITFSLFLCVLIAYTMRVNLSVSVVAMLDSANANPNFPEYSWSEGEKSLVLSSFFWGYVLMQIPGGQLALVFGPTPLLIVSLIGTSLFAILTPGAAAWGGWGLVCAFRVCQGLSQGLMFPSTHTILAKWLPVEERGVLATFVYAGAQLGTVLALPVCGVLSTSALGWPTNFYLFGALGLVWAVFWFFVGANSPAEHPRISEEERNYIHDSLGVGQEVAKTPATPWKSLLTSLPLWALLVANCGHGWGFTTLLTEMPSFMNSVLGFDLQANGLLSAVPYLAMFAMSFVFSSLAALVARKQWLSLTNNRKLFNSIGEWGPMIALLGLAYSTNATLSVVLLTITVGISSSIYVGYNVNHIDLAPNFAGTMMGMSNGAANIMSIISPIVVGAVVPDVTNANQWRTVFFIASGIYLFANAFYVAFGKAELQPWNTPKEKPVKLAVISGTSEELR